MKPSARKPLSPHCLIDLALMAIFASSAPGCLGAGLKSQALRSGGAAGVDKKSNAFLLPFALNITPLSPTQVRLPEITGLTEKLASVILYSGPDCSGSAIGITSADVAGNFDVTSAVLPDGAHQLSVRSIASDGRSACSAPMDYVVDNAGPTLALTPPSLSLARSSASIIYEVAYTGASNVLLTANDIVLDTAGGATCDKAVTYHDNSWATVQLTNCTGNGTVGITIVAGSATDVAGNSALCSPASATFVVDNVGISSGIFFPPSGDTSVLPSTFTVTLPEAPYAPSVHASDFVVSGTCAGVAVSSVSVSGGVLTGALSGTSGCALNQTVIVTLDFTGIEDNAGNFGVGSQAATWRVQNVGPTSATFSPGTSTVNPIPSSVVVNYNAAVLPASVAAGDFAVTGTCAGVSVASVSTSGAASTLALAGTGGCAHGQTVIVTAALTGITNLGGSAGVGTASVTYTRDTAGPTVSLAPASATLGAMPTAVQATFAADTDMSTVSAADFAVGGTCAGASLGLVNKSGNVATVNITGAASCANGQTLTVTTGLGGVADNVGNAGSGSPSVTYVLDVVGPGVVLNVSSANVAAFPATITATFDSDTDMATVTAADFTLAGTCVGPTISSVTKAANVATLNLAGLGACSNTQTISIAANLTGVSDVLANAGAGAVTAVLTLDMVGPTVTIGTPSGHYNPAPVSVSATFDADTNMASVSAATFSTGGTCAGTSIGSVTKSGRVATVAITGTASCAALGTVVLNANLAGVLDNVGNFGTGMQSATYVFDNIGPLMVLGLSSGNYKPLPTSIPITFDADTDMSTVTAADFGLLGTCTGAAISSVTKSGQVATVSLGGTTSCLTLGTVILSTNLAGIKDMTGNPGIGVQLLTMVYDNTGPTASISPATGVYSALPTAIAVTFSPDTDMSTVDATTFGVLGTCVGTSIASVTKSANVATVNLGGSNFCVVLQTMIFSTTLTNVVDMNGNHGLGAQLLIYTKGI